VSTLKVVACGGSAVAADLIARFSRKFPGVSLAQVGFAASCKFMSFDSCLEIIVTGSYKLNHLRLCSSIILA
jgi:hypothetical protein